MSRESHILPSYFLQPDYWCESASQGAFSSFTGSAWPASNRAIYVPVQFPADCTVFGIQALGANTTGNYDIGLYGPDFGRLTNKGSTAMAAAVLSHTFSDLRVYGGMTYYMALALSSSSGSVGRVATGALIRLTVLGVAQEASALPLPSTMTPAAPANDYVPFMTVRIR